MHNFHLFRSSFNFVSYFAFVVLYSFSQERNHKTNDFWISNREKKKEEEAEAAIIVLDMGSRISWILDLTFDSEKKKKEKKDLLLPLFHFSVWKCETWFMLHFRGSVKSRFGVLFLCSRHPISSIRSPYTSSIFAMRCLPDFDVK